MWCNRGGGGEVMREQRKFIVVKNRTEICPFTWGNELCHITTSLERARELKANFQLSYVMDKFTIYELTRVERDENA